MTARIGWPKISAGGNRLAAGPCRRSPPRESQMLNRVAPASAVMIQLISATTLMTASLSLVNQSGRPGDSSASAFAASWARIAWS